MYHIVASDLDGTLLDHHDYSHEAALPMLRRLRMLCVSSGSLPPPPPPDRLSSSDRLLSWNLTIPAGSQ